MRQAFRAVLAAAIVFLAASGTRAQQFSSTNVITFAPVPAGDLTEVPRADIDDKLNAKTDLRLRPNVATELYLWVLNPNEDKDEFIVELKDAKDTFSVRAKVTIPGNTWKRVKFPKPAAPAAPAVPPAAAPAAPAAQPSPEPPPPPGTKLPLSGGEGKLIFRLLDKNGLDLKDAGGAPYGKASTVQFRSPSDYIETPVLKVTPEKGRVSLNATVTQKPFAYPGSATIRLYVPPQPELKDAVLRDGFYRRTLTFDTARKMFDQKNPAPSVALSGIIENPGVDARIYVGVDGIDRAFDYKLTTFGKTEGTQLTNQKTVDVRVSRAAASAVTQPVATYPVLIEVDNSAATDTLELRLRPVRGDNELTETVKIDSVRDVQVWLDTAGPTDGGLLFTTKSRDWVRPLDLTRLQGKIEVEAVLVTKTGEVKSQPPLLLTVDGTPPERITFLPIDPQLEKGKPLVVSASVNDPDTDVTKATFFLCRQLEDGKMPADAVKAVGSQSAKNPQVWNANLTVPADFRGNGLVGVVFTNQAGLATDPPLVQKVEIVDAKPPTGAIRGAVTFGDRPQPGVAVSLRDAEGKEKAATVSDKDGKFEFEKVPVGSYKVVALKKDSSTGAAGIAPVQVDAEHTLKKPAKVIVSMNKIRM